MAQPSIWRRNMKPLNVLSLFDGISCAQIALERAGFKVANYFASEIEKNSIKITQHNYQNTIQLGDVTKIKAADLPQIDLLVGGSPCQGFSICGKQLNFDDPRSKLFFEYVRLLKECKPRYFLLENVGMKKEYQDVISEHLSCQPIAIDSQLLSAQTRARLYWTNILGVEQPKDVGIVTRDILDTVGPFVFVADIDLQYLEYTKRFVNFSYCRAWLEVFDRRWQKAVRLSKKHNCLVCRTSSHYIYFNDTTIRKTTTLEQERLQTVPDNYTACVCKTARRHALANGFTVDVIAYILGHIDKGIRDADQLDSSDLNDLII